MEDTAGRTCWSTSSSTIRRRLANCESRGMLTKSGPSGNQVMPPLCEANRNPHYGIQRDRQRISPWRLSRGREWVCGEQRPYLPAAGDCQVEAEETAHHYDTFLGAVP